MAEEYRFVYHHFRRPRHWRGTKRHGEPCIRYTRGVSKFKPGERGGVTTCYVVNEDGNPLALGRAVCCMRDSFCYRMGRIIAQARALAALGGHKFKPWNGIILGESPTVFGDAKLFYIPA